MADNESLKVNVSGLCLCGCGNKTDLAKSTYKKIGHVKGQPLRYIKGHQYPKRACSIDDCESKHFANGMCSLHYNRWTRGGDMHKEKRQIGQHSSGYEGVFWDEHLKEWIESANGRTHKNWRIWRLEVLSYYSKGRPVCSCVNCEVSEIEFLAIDHIEGGGNKHREQIRSEGYQGGLVGWIRKQGYPKGFRVLCHNCNSAIGYYGYCPHEKVKNG